MTRHLAPTCSESPGEQRRSVTKRTELVLQKVGQESPGQSAWGPAAAKAGSAAAGRQGGPPPPALPIPAPSRELPATPPHGAAERTGGTGCLREAKLGRRDCDVRIPTSAGAPPSGASSAPPTETRRRPTHPRTGVAGAPRTRLFLRRGASSGIPGYVGGYGKREESVRLHFPVRAPRGRRPRPRLCVPGVLRALLACGRAGCWPPPVGRPAQPPGIGTRPTCCGTNVGGGGGGGRQSVFYKFLSAPTCPSPVVGVGVDGNGLER